MTGLYATKTLSLGTLDQLMDLAVMTQRGQLTPQDILSVPLTFRAVDLIAGSVARLPCHVWRGESDATALALPANWTDLIYRLTSSLLIFNAAYALRETNRFNLNEQWRLLVSPRVQIVQDPQTKQLSGFRYDSRPIDDYESRLLWWWWPNITGEVGPGPGPTSAALADAEMLRALTEFAAAYFKSGGTPTTIAQQSGVVLADEVEKFESWWTALKNGVKRAFRAVLISDQIKFSQIGTSIKDTIAPELYQQSARNVAIAYGIPLSVLMSDAANYATALDDHVKFYTETVLPLATRLYEVWNTRIYAPRGMRIEAAPSELEIMQQFEVKKAVAVVGLVGGPVLSRDEGRAMLGYKPESAATEPPEPPALRAGEAADIKQVDLVTTERERLKRYAHNRLNDGRPFAFRSDIIGAREIDAVRACQTHADIENLDLADFDRPAGVAQLIEAINAARAELREALHE